MEPIKTMDDALRAEALRNRLKYEYMHGPNRGLLKEQLSTKAWMIDENNKNEFIELEENKIDLSKWYLWWKTWLAIEDRRSKLKSPALMEIDVKSLSKEEFKKLERESIMYEWEELTNGTN